MALTAADLKQMRYRPERFPDGIVATIAAVGTLPTPPLALTTLQDENVFARLGGLAVVPAGGSANVVVQAAADGASFPPSGFSVSTAQLPSTVLSEDVLGLTCTTSAQLTFTNAGSASAANFQAAWHLWGWTPSLADYRALGVTPPAALAALQGLLPAGIIPVAVPERLISSLFARPQVLTFASTATVQSGGQTPITLAGGNPPAGWFDVLRFIAVDDSVAGSINLATRVSNAVQVSIARDGTDPLRTYPAYCLNANPTVNGVLDTSRVIGTRPWIVSRASWRVYLTATAQVTSVPYLIIAERYLEQPEHRLLWGIGTAADLALTRGGTPVSSLIAAGVY